MVHPHSGVGTKVIVELAAAKVAATTILKELLAESEDSDSGETEQSRD